MNDKQFAVMFRRAERPGFYCRVLKTGTVVCGDEVQQLEYDQSPKFSIVDMFRLYYVPSPSAELLQQVLQLPVAIRERKRLESVMSRIRQTK